MGCYNSKLPKDNYIYSPKVQPNQVLSLGPVKTSKGKNNEKKKRTKSDHPHSRNSPNSSKEMINDRRINTKYKIKAVIGKGSFSKVVRVEDRLTRQPYALKMIESSEGRDVFEAELTVLRRVNHPNVIRLVEVFESNQKIFMVMELATGGSLLDRLETYGFCTENEAQRILKMVLQGINYLHSLGITHRDLKPDNLLYYHPGHGSKILITDFGFASTSNSNGNPYMHTVCGTPQYIAPEIVARRPYTNAVDMWAIGVISFIVLSGTFPFDAKLDSQIFKQILKGKYSFSAAVWEGISKDAKTFITKLLVNDPEVRLTASEAFSDDWIKTVFPLVEHVRRTACVRRSGSLRSSQSAGSSKSCRSLRSDHRVQTIQLEALQGDPEISAML